MNWLLNLLQKVLQFFTGKPKYLKNPIGQNKGQTPISKPAAKRPVEEIYKPTGPANYGVGEPSKKYSSSVSGENLSSRIHVQSQPSKTSITDAVDQDLMKNRRQVNYEPSHFYRQNPPQYFPYVLMPSKNTVIKPPVNGKSSNKGMTEESFCRDFLLKYFRGNVFDNLSVFIGTTPFEPDLAIINLESGKNIFIDIEIDEPYDGVSKTPTHYRTAKGTIDDARNDGFTDRGWMVIRFAEEQIVTNPNGCVKFIGQVIKSVCPSYSSKCLELPNALERIPIWSEAEARSYAREHKREKYLSIIDFFKSESTRDYTIKDTLQGLEIEKNLNPKNAISHNATTLRPSVAKTPSYHSNPTTSAPQPVAKSSIPPPIVNRPSNDEPRITTKTENPSKPSPQPYANN